MSVYTFTMPVTFSFDIEADNESDAVDNACRVWERARRQDETWRVLGEFTNPWLDTPDRKPHWANITAEGRTQSRSGKLASAQDVDAAILALDLDIETFFQARGWRLVRDTPGRVGEWQKTLPDGRIVLAASRDIMLRLEEGLDHESRQHSLFK